MEVDDRNKLGLWSLILLGINAVVGPGVFLLPGKAMALVGPSSMFVYLFVTVAAIAIAFCFAECASLFSRNGAAYVYAKEAFGDFVGFQVGIMKWAVSIIAWAALAVGFITVLGQIWPEAAQEPYRTVIIVGMLSSLGTLNILGVRMIRLLNNMITIGKVIPLVLFVLLGFLFIQGNNFTPLMPSTVKFESFGAAALVIFFAFSGFEVLAVAAEDISNPRKNLPMAILSVLLITSVLYFLLQAVVIGILGPSLADSPAPVIDAAYEVFGPAGKLLVMVCMLIAGGGTNIAASFVAPRSGVALAQDKMVPSVIAKTGKFGTPTWAIVITVILTTILALSGSFVKLAAISVVARLAQYFPTCLAVIFLRKNRPDLRSDFPRICGPVIPLFALLFSTWLLWNASADEIAWGLGGLVVGAPLYMLRKTFT